MQTHRRDLEVAGWALPIDGEVKLTQFIVNGTLAAVAYPLDRPDVGDWHTRWPHAGRSGFVMFISDYEKVADVAGGDLILEIRKKPGTAIGPFQRVYLPTNPELLANVPEFGLIKRAGQDNEEIFAISGYNHYRLLSDVLQKVAGRKMQQFETLLDWGCGCGRILRNLLADAGSNGDLYGVDIDADQVNWCLKHLPGASFAVVPLSPPLPFQNGTFEVVLGYSVMTNLSPSLAMRWLEELNRVMKKDGIALLSIHGDAALVYHAKSFDPYAAAILRQAGVFDSGHKADPDRVVEGSAYYRDTYYIRDHIRNTWGKLFEIADIIENFGGYQDLVVLRRR